MLIFAIEVWTFFKHDILTYTETFYYFDLRCLNMYYTYFTDIIVYNLHTGIKFALIKSDPSTSSNGASATREWSTAIIKLSVRHFHQCTSGLNSGDKNASTCITYIQL